MNYARKIRHAMTRARTTIGILAFVSEAGACILSGMGPTAAYAQQPASTDTMLVFDSVTVVDVEHGALIPDQQVVIVGSRIRAIGDRRTATTPRGARVVDGRGKYLIPGLWDMHTHADRKTDLYYPLLVANGVTGIRDAGSSVPLDTLIQWRREIVAGRRVGPPRQLLSGQSIGDSTVQARAMAADLAEENPLWQALADAITAAWTCHRNELLHSIQNCVIDAADARRVVDSLKAAGADMIKPRAVPRETYFAIAAEARRLHIPFGGHIWDVKGIDAYLTAVEASDSGASIVDHAEYLRGCWTPPVSLALCQSIADRFRRNGTWWVPTLSFSGRQGADADAVAERLAARATEFWAGARLHGNWLGDSGSPTAPQLADASSRPDSTVPLRMVQRAGLPILAGTDNTSIPVTPPRPFAPGFALHAELAIYAAEGLTPAEALQTATVNPAKLLKATDSLGTVAPGKLADLVLLDANPLADITNTTTVRAVVANGRYFDRAALDQLLVEAQAKAKTESTP